MENKIPVMVLSALVLIGIIGASIVLKTETTAQLSYQVYERPPAFSRVLTTKQCEAPAPDLAMKTEDCIEKGAWDCAYKYPITAGGAQNACLKPCINQVTSQCG
jgi:hypothetical protein